MGKPKLSITCSHSKFPFSNNDNCFCYSTTAKGQNKNVTHGPYKNVYHAVIDALRSILDRDKLPKQEVLEVAIPAKLQQIFSALNDPTMSTAPKLDFGKLGYDIWVDENSTSEQKIDAERRAIETYKVLGLTNSSIQKFRKPVVSSSKDKGKVKLTQDRGYIYVVKPSSRDLQWFCRSNGAFKLVSTGTNKHNAKAFTDCVMISYTKGRSYLICTIPGETEPNVNISALFPSLEFSTQFCGPAYIISTSPLPGHKIEGAVEDEIVSSFGKDPSKAFVSNVSMDDVVALKKQKDKKSQESKKKNQLDNYLTNFAGLVSKRVSEEIDEEDSQVEHRELKKRHKY